MGNGHPIAAVGSAIDGAAGRRALRRRATPSELHAASYLEELLALMLEGMKENESGTQPRHFD